MEGFFRRAFYSRGTTSERESTEHQNSSAIANRNTPIKSTCGRSGCTLYELALTQRAFSHDWKSLTLQACTFSLKDYSVVIGPEIVPSLIKECQSQSQESSCRIDFQLSNISLIYIEYLLRIFTIWMRQVNHRYLTVFTIRFNIRVRE